MLRLFASRARSGLARTGRALPAVRWGAPEPSARQLSTTVLKRALHATASAKQGSPEDETTVTQVGDAQGVDAAEVDALVREYSVSYFAKDFESAHAVRAKLVEDFNVSIAKVPAGDGGTKNKAFLWMVEPEKPPWYSNRGKVRLTMDLLAGPLENYE